MRTISTGGHIYIRRDFNYIWEKINPVIAEDELICVMENHKTNFTNRYKLGDGKHTYTELDFLNDIPKFFKLCGIYIHLDGTQCNNYLDTYSERKRKADRYVELKDSNDGLIDLSEYYPFNYELLLNHLENRMICNEVVIKFKDTCETIEPDRKLRSHLNFSGLFADNHEKIVLSAKTKYAYDKLIKFLAPYKKEKINNETI